MFFGVIIIFFTPNCAIIASGLLKGSFEPTQSYLYINSDQEVFILDMCALNASDLTTGPYVDTGLAVNAFLFYGHM